MLWNTGWAKLAELIDAYEVKDSRSNESLSLGLKTSDGALEVVNSRTALVVNKHWILLLGLLGVYGGETKKGILQTGIRNDFADEQAPIRNFGIAAAGAVGLRALRARMDYRRTSHDRPVVRELFESDPTDNDMWTGPMSLRRSAYGEWTLESQGISSMRGMTGTIRALGRHKGSWSLLSAVSFVPHSARQMFKAKTQEKSFRVPISTSFWLAYGFISCGRASEDRETVISLESPARRIMDSYPGNKHTLGWTVFSLTESDDLPVSIGHAMMHLGITEPRILQFLPLTPFADLVSEDHQAKIVDHIKYRDFSDILHDSPITADGTFVYGYENELSGYLVFPLRQFERVLSALISLEWDDWGLLTWKDKFWISVLSPILVGLQCFSAKEEKAFGAALGHTPPVPGLRVPSAPASLPHFLHLDKLISTSLRESNTRPLLLAIGCIYIIESSFRQFIHMTRRSLLEDSMSIEELLELERSVVKTEESLLSIRQKYSEMNSDSECAARSSGKSMRVRNADSQRRRASLSDYSEASDSESDEYRSRRGVYRSRSHEYSESRSRHREERARHESRSRRHGYRSSRHESRSESNAAPSPGTHVLNIPGSISRQELESIGIVFTGVNYDYDPVNDIVSYHVGPDPENAY